MKLTTHDIASVGKNRRSNPYHRWHGPGDAAESAACRLSAGSYVRVHTGTKFQIPSGAKIFTIGSCFARNAERALRDRGMSVPALDFVLPPSWYAAEDADPSGVLNKYNSHSIEAEVLSALEAETLPDDGLVRIPGDLWWDPLTTGMKPLPREDALSVRKGIRELTREVANCDVVLITLGLNQVWIDSDTGAYLNEFPPTSVVRAYPQRWVAAWTGVEENYRSCERTIRAITAANPSARIVMTVSPVPMGTTLTRLDVITANTYSKSVLRVCAQMISERFESVDYFPSYEMAMNSPPELTWRPDRLHVTEEAVRFIVDCFIEDYVNIGNAVRT